MSLPILVPDSQIYFATRLEAIRDLYFDRRLGKAISEMPLENIDSELHSIVSGASLSTLARHGLRGQTFYAVPSILMAEPYLLGYYRLLYGISQKQFYGRGAFSIFKHMEMKGTVSETAKEQLSIFCSAMAGTGDILIASLV